MAGGSEALAEREFDAARRTNEDEARCIAQPVGVEFVSEVAPSQRQPAGRRVPRHRSVECGESVDLGDIGRLGVEIAIVADAPDKRDRERPGGIGDDEIGKLLGNILWPVKAVVAPPHDERRDVGRYLPTAVGHLSPLLSRTRLPETGRRFVHMRLIMR